MNSAFPTACAVISILSEDIIMILVTYQALGRVSHFSITAKALCATVGCLATVGRCILIIDSKVVHCVIEILLLKIYVKSSLMYMCSDSTRQSSPSSPAWAPLTLQHCTGPIGVVSGRSSLCKIN